MSIVIFRNNEIQYINDNGDVTRSVHVDGEITQLEFS